MMRGPFQAIVVVILSYSAISRATIKIDSLDEIPSPLNVPRHQYGPVDVLETFSHATAKRSQGDSDPDMFGNLRDLLFNLETVLDRNQRSNLPPKAGFGKLWRNYGKRTEIPQELSPSKGLWAKSPANAKREEYRLLRRLRSDPSWGPSGQGINWSPYNKRNQYMLLRKGRDTSSEESKMELLQITDNEPSHIETMKEQDRMSKLRSKRYSEIGKKKNDSEYLLRFDQY
ncbi:uncharacterized protein LOC131882632 isoform X2 [Tigriopus californicus]|uniref:uncharacterized protein LOC131882632 isoform X2 n=1 Tax=Tigriopus californicus TaxID=6832 RepID=UPI0027DA4954|nr:uncharacterized protein LOC131882632 isoform X2 [Tigriopus californicus]